MTFLHVCTGSMTIGSRRHAAFFARSLRAF